MGSNLKILFFEEGHIDEVIFVDEKFCKAFKAKDNQSDELCWIKVSQTLNSNSELFHLGDKYLVSFFHL